MAVLWHGFGTILGETGIGFRSGVRTPDATIAIYSRRLPPAAREFAGPRGHFANASGQYDSSMAQGALRIERTENLDSADVRRTAAKRSRSDGWPADLHVGLPVDRIAESKEPRRRRRALSDS